MDKIAVLGFGSSGKRFVSLIQERLPEAKILVFSSQRLTGNTFESTSEISDVRKFKPTIAIICGVASGRLEMIEALPEKLLGTLVEKPLAVNFDEGIEAKKKLEERGGIIQVGYNLRFSPFAAGV